jgi:serine/threonine protein kinase
MSTNSGSRLRITSEIQNFQFSRGQRALLENVEVFIKEPNNQTESQTQILNEIYFIKKIIGCAHVLFPVEILEGSRLVFPYIEKSLLDYSEKLSHQQVLEQILNPLLTALIYIHSKGVVHGDLKIENIRITEELKIYISDFGNSQSTHGHNAHRICALSQHQAPDISISPIYDIYSIGVLTFQMLFGLEFIRDFQIKNRNFNDIPESKNIPLNLLNFIKIATAPNVADRFHSAQAAYDFIFSDKALFTKQLTIEKYDLENYFEVYLEFMKQIFIASHLPISRFDEFIGANGEKYHNRLCCWLESSKTLLLHVKLGESIIGIIETSILNDGRGQISSLFIHQNYRNQGIAKKLQEKAFEFFKSRSCHEVILNVAQTNELALAHYQRTGWEKTNLSNYPDSVCLRYAKWF